VVATDARGLEFRIAIMFPTHGEPPQTLISKSHSAGITFASLNDTNTQEE
jgi:hypothetical protein